MANSLLELTKKAVSTKKASKDKGTTGEGRNYAEKPVAQISDAKLADNGQSMLVKVTFQHEPFQLPSGTIRLGSTEGFGTTAAVWNGMNVVVQFAARLEVPKA